MSAPERLILALGGLWITGSLAIGAWFSVTAVRGRRDRRKQKLRTSGESRPAAPVGHADLLASVPGAFMLDRELDLLAVRLNPLYYGAPNVVRPERQRAHAVRAAITRRNADDRRFADLPDHDDWSHA